MNEQKDSFEDLVTQWAVKQGSGHEAHPGPETLADFHDELLDEAQASAIQTHLIGCRSCTQYLLAYASDEAIDEEVAPSAFLAETVKTQAHPVSHDQKGKRNSFLFLTQAAAALFLMSTASLLMWNLSLNKKLGEAQEPITDSDKVNLNPEGAWSPRNAGPTSRIIDGEKPLVLLLNNLELPAHTAFHVLIKNHNGETLWEKMGLKPDEHHVFTVILPQNYLKADIYEIQLLDGEQKTILATYRLDLSQSTR